MAAQEIILPGPSLSTVSVTPANGEGVATTDTSTAGGNRSKRKRPNNRLSPEYCIERVCLCIQEALLISTHEEFRQKSFRTMSVTNAQEAKDSVKRKLNGFYETSAKRTTAPKPMLSARSEVMDPLATDRSFDVHLKFETASSIGDGFSGSQCQSPSYASSQVSDSILSNSTPTPRYVASELRRWFRRSSTPSLGQGQSQGHRPSQGDGHRGSQGHAYSQGHRPSQGDGHSQGHRQSQGHAHSQGNGQSQQNSQSLSQR